MSRLYLVLIVSFLSSFISDRVFSFHIYKKRINTYQWVNKELMLLENETLNLNPKALRLALIAYLHARERGLDSKKLLTVIDYSMPSNQKRLWVFDLKNNVILFNTWVSHGEKSGASFATSFSNNEGSHKSSIGVFLTDSTYFGNHGYSLKLKGMEYGINDNAYSRHIVIHGAWYVGKKAIQKYGALGRTYGCPAVNSIIAQPLIDTIKDNTLLFVYYPDQNWLKNSRFLALR